jgi:uncharacterized membrane protein
VGSAGGKDGMLGTGRLEAFTDGVIAIVITIMAVALTWFVPDRRIEPLVMG